MSVIRKFSGKVALITGAYEGIGYETALSLAQRNYKVIISDKESLSEIKRNIKQESGNDNIIEKFVDFACFDSVRNFANDILHHEERLHVLINNAGIFNSSEEKSKDNLNFVMQVNHYSPFLLTFLLLDLLKKSSPSRIIFLTSVGSFLHTIDPADLEGFSTNIFSGIVNPTLNYYNSKLCNMVSSKLFAEKLRNTGVTCNCLHPGMTSSKLLIKGIDILKYVSPVAEKIVRYAAQDIGISAKLPVFLATSQTVENISGQYFVNYQIHKQPAALENQKFCMRIWEETEKIVGLHK